MRRCAVFGGLLAVLIAQAVAQNSPTVLVQSFRHGPTRMADHNMVVNLSGENQYFEAKIEDASGDPRYLLNVVPHWPDVADHRVIAWEVKLVDSHRKYLGNLLTATPPTDPLSDRAEDRAWRLDPNPYAVPPILTRRIFKVESFYCVVQVKEHHFTGPERRFLDAMKVEIAFTSKDVTSN